jgi:hypothetical protein
MKNTTLNRKPSNTMKPGEGKYMPHAKANQRGDGADFAFNGQMGDGVNRGGRQDICDNQYGHLVQNPDRINHGRKSFALRGNTSDQSVDRMERIGPAATKDAVQLTMATAAQGHNVGRSVRVPRWANPDAINVGMK